MHIVVSQVDFTSAKGDCVANYCQCGDYFATLKFVVKSNAIYESSVKIEGADDFRSHDNKVFVIVIAEDKKNTSKIRFLMEKRKKNNLC